MGIIGLIGLGIEIIKLIFAIIGIIKEIKKKDPAFKVKDVVQEVNTAIADKANRPNLKVRLEKLRDELKRQRDSVVPGPSDTKGL